MKEKIFAILALLLITSMLFQGCAKKAAPPEKETEEVSEEPTEVDEDFSDIDNLEEDLSMEELEGLDKELEEINW